MAKILTGIQSTGTPHLGNILGAIIPAVEMANSTSDESYLFIANMHSLTQIKNKKILKQNTFSTAATWLAFGLDPKILNKTYNLAANCKKNNIRINTFMIASDPYLMEFVEKFTEINDGSAYFADLNNLGSMIFKDYNKNKIRKY